MVCLMQQMFSCNTFNAVAEEYISDEYKHEHLEGFSFFKFHWLSHAFLFLEIRYTSILSFHHSLKRDTLRKCLP